MVSEKTTHPPLPTPHSVEKSTLLFDEFFAIRRDELLNDRGERFPYYTLIMREDAVVILGKTSSNLYIINREYRHPVAKTLLSLPGGYINPGETILQSAERELLEESGFSAQSFLFLGNAFPYPGISNQKISYVYATECYPKRAPLREPAESMTTELWQPNAVHQAIQAGAWVDANLCTALYYLSIKSDE